MRSHFTLTASHLTRQGPSYLYSLIMIAWSRAAARMGYNEICRGHTSLPRGQTTFPKAHTSLPRWLPTCRAWVAHQSPAPPGSGFAAPACTMQQHTNGMKSGHRSGQLRAGPSSPLSIPASIKKKCSHNNHAHVERCRKGYEHSMTVSPQLLDQ